MKNDDMYLATCGVVYFPDNCTCSGLFLDQMQINAYLLDDRTFNVTEKQTHADSYKSVPVYGLVSSESDQRKQNQVPVEKFQGKHPQLDMETWDEQHDDDQERAFIYDIGMKDKQIKKKNKQLLEPFVGATTTANADLFVFIIVASSLPNWTNF